MAIGFIGLGNMGALMAGRLADAGTSLIVHDIRPEVVAAFCRGRDGVIAAATLQQIARDADIVITILPTSREVAEVVLGNGGDALLPGLRRGSIVVDMTSGVPTETQKIAAAIAGTGAVMVDAPVSGGVKGARDGTLAVMVGGPAEVVDGLRPLLSIMGAKIFRAGDVGAGQAIKALNNFVSAMGLMAAGEALVVGQRFGLAPEAMVDILNASSGRNNSTENKLKPFVLPGRYADGFAFKLMQKDLSIAAALAAEVGRPDGLAAVCSQMWANAAAAVGDGADHTEIVKAQGFDAKGADKA